MAQTVSSVPVPEVAWHGEAVTIEDVLGALSGIRRKFAQAEAGDKQALARLRTVNRVRAGSPALLAREQQA